MKNIIGDESVKNSTDVLRVLVNGTSVASV
jgi:hypothetical protein